MAINKNSLYYMPVSNGAWTKDMNSRMRELPSGLPYERAAYGLHSEKDRTLVRVEVFHSEIVQELAT